MWFFRDMARLHAERAAIERLAADSPWVERIEWRLGGALSVDVDIRAGNHTYPVTLRYPDVFPDSPPSLSPRHAEFRWSTHQYGSAGELCLEYGPDNWCPELTGADMLASGHRLLDTERPLERESGEEVPTRHRVTLGQSLKWTRYRFQATAPLLSKLAGLPVGTTTDAGVLALRQRESLCAVVASLHDGEGEWRDVSIPYEALKDAAHVWRAVAARLPEGFVFPESGSDVRGAVEAALGVELALGEDGDAPFLLAVSGETVHMYWLLDPACGTVIRFETMGPGTLPPSVRLPAGHSSMGTARVGIVGCGSVGSKVATSLARSGISRFLLIDDDIELPENLVRNDLDWRDVGSHKAVALARRIELVNPAAQCEYKVARLGGQESSGFASSLVLALSGCDLIVDATADAAAFNLTAAAAAHGKRPMVWMEVFAGGIGGMVARHRPGVDPVPRTMRDCINAWCADRDAPWNATDGEYASVGEDGRPMVADDADVSVVAAHAARMAIDLLAHPGASLFPHSAYMLGLAPGWIFTEPFETWPIAFPPPEEEPVAAATLSETERDEVIGFVVGLLERAKNEGDDHR